MALVKVSSKVEESVWNDLRALASESHQNISGLLTEANHLGNVAYRVGKKLQWDAENLRFLYQGRDPQSRGNYSLLPYRLGLLTLDRAGE